MTRYPNHFNITLLDCGQIRRSDDTQCGLANAQVIQGSQPEDLNTRGNQNSEMMMNHDIKLTMLTCDQIQLTMLLSLLLPCTA